MNLDNTTLFEEVYYPILKDIKNELIEDITKEYIKNWMNENIFPELKKIFN